MRQPKLSASLGGSADARGLGCLGLFIFGPFYASVLWHYLNAFVLDHLGSWRNVGWMCGGLVLVWGIIRWACRPSAQAPLPAPSEAAPVATATASVQEEITPVQAAPQVQPTRVSTRASRLAEYD